MVMILYGKRKKKEKAEEPRKEKSIEDEVQDLFDD